MSDSGRVDLMAEDTHRRWVVRPPQPAEAPAIRMLLPRRPGAAALPGQYLLALQPGTASIVGAASFSVSPAGSTALRLHVIPPFRRQRVGTALVQAIMRSAPAAGVRGLTGEVHPMSEPDAPHFAEALGFQRLHRLCTMTAPVADLRGQLTALRQRLRQSGRIPAAAQLVMLPEAPQLEIARLFEQWISLEGVGAVPTQALTREASAASPVVMVEGEVAGFLLWQMQGETAIVLAWVVPPRWSNSWVNVALLAEALDIGWAAGARQIEYDVLDGNHQPTKLAQRAGGTVHRIADTYRLDL
ncbi:MAG: GNAT family N-acetyltransferase [Acidobacteria bacterium]|nr:GNAT family N-acetyltransferase [Acidobacteriota bacterium]